MSLLDDARKRLANFYTSTKLDALGVHTVTFQPLQSRISEDRIVTEEWSIQGQHWAFLAVLDGHGGTATAEYAMNELPLQIHTALHLLFQNHLHGRLDRSNVGHGEQVSLTLRQEIERFDTNIGKAVKNLCRKPHKLTEEGARTLIQEHSDTLQRAFCGTTLAAALVNIEEKLMWAVGVGDSTVALTTVGEDGKPRCQRLTDVHSPTTPSEYFRVAMAHPAAEKEVLAEDRVLGFLAMTRAIGDFSLKYHRAFLSHLFRYMPTTFLTPLETVIPWIKTPPYLIVEPSVQFIDLRPYWEAKPTIVLFTDGVDCLIDGYFNFTPGKNSGGNPSQIVAALLQDGAVSYVEETLGHKVEVKPTGLDGNKAVDVLGNLVGGMDVEKLEVVMNQELLAGKSASPGFYVDDTSIVIFEVFKATSK